MNLRHTALVGLLVSIGLVAWHSELWIVARPGDRPLPLVPAARRAPARFDVTLPAVPIGSQRLASGGAVLLIHYWAPWERHGREQARSLDSLRRLPALEGVRVVVVCCDPFPSVTRYVARERLRLNVVLDTRGELRRVLPCPSLPYTYVMDGSGNVALAQAGEVDWLSARTRATLEALRAEPPPEAGAARIPS